MSNQIISCDLSADEQSPYYLCTLQTSDAAEFASLELGQALSITVMGETFNLIVDSKTLSRDPVPTYAISALSPVALFDAPFAQTTEIYSEVPVDARTTVESLIGSVSWLLPDWWIPELALTGLTPLSAARRIIEAAGGVIESLPDGSVQCRLLHPVNVPDYESASAAFELFDDEVFQSSSNYQALSRFNRVTLSNETASTTENTDRLEQVVLEDASKEVRAYLSRTRPVTLVHSGHPSTQITALGSVSRTETETVEFVEGQAQTAYPVAAIISITWQHTNLGSVTFDKQTLKTQSGYSLAVINYRVDYLAWAVDSVEEVQFILVDS